MSKRICNFLIPVCYCPSYENLPDWTQTNTCEVNNILRYKIVNLPLNILEFKLQHAMLIKKEQKYCDNIMWVFNLRIEYKFWQIKKEVPELGRKKTNKRRRFSVYNAGQLKHSQESLNTLNLGGGEAGSLWPVDNFRFHFPNRMVTQQATKSFRPSQATASKQWSVCTRLTTGLFPFHFLK